MKTLLESLKERDLIDAVTSPELDQYLLENSIQVYIGFDPTADSLHLGNFMGMQLLSWFQKFGHTPVVVLGGATGKIGDPSGKSKERPLLEDKVIEYNIERIRQNFMKILDFSGKLPMPIFIDNGSWFKEIRFVDFLRDVGKHFRMGSMLAKESVRSRIHSEEGMSFTEFSYQLLQAYDFYHLFKQGVCLQMGGSDQWGNITAGVELIRRLSGKTGFGLTFPLLVRSDGKKFGKSEEGAVWLAEDKLSPYEFYQYLIGIPDLDVIALLKKLTFMEIQEIQKIEDEMKMECYEPNTAQKILAKELTIRVHGEEGFAKALRATQNAGPKMEGDLSYEKIVEISADIPNIFLKKDQVIGKKFTEVAVLSGLLESRGEGVRLIQNEGAYLNNKKILEVSFLIQENLLIGGEFLLLGSGKKKRILVRVS